MNLTDLPVLAAGRSFYLPEKNITIMGESVIHWYLTQRVQIVPVSYQ